MYVDVLDVFSCQFVHVQMRNFIMGRIYLWGKYSIWWLDWIKTHAFRKRWSIVELSSFGFFEVTSISVSSVWYIGHLDVFSDSVQSSEFEFIEKSVAIRFIIQNISRYPDVIHLRNVVSPLELSNPDKKNDTILKYYLWILKLFGDKSVN